MVKAVNHRDDSFTIITYMNTIIPIPPRIKMIDVIIIPTLNPLSPNRSYSKRRKLNPLSALSVISNIHFHLRMAPIRSKVPRVIIIKPPFTGVMLLKKSGSLFIFIFLLFLVVFHFTIALLVMGCSLQPSGGIGACYQLYYISNF